MFICISSIKLRLFYTLFVIYLFINGCDSQKPDGEAADRVAGISPDYSNSVIPPNIAPLNFIVKEAGNSYYIDIFCENDEDHIIINQKSNKIQIPQKQWHRLLQKNRGQTLYIDISVRELSGQWLKFNTIKNQIVDEEIDSYIAYRLINPGYVLWWEMGIYQRCLENFDESTVFSNKLTKMNCMNCHCFCNNNPDRIIIIKCVYFRLIRLYFYVPEFAFISYEIESSQSMTRISLSVKKLCNDLTDK